MACMSDLGFTSRTRAGGFGSHPGRRKVRRPIPQAILPRECTKCSLLRIPELWCCFTAGGISQAGSANGSGRSLRRVGPGPGGIHSSPAWLWLHTGYIVKLLNSARQTSVSASTGDSIQAALVSGRLVSHVTYLWTPSDTTRNFHGRGAALDLKRFGVHGHVRVLLGVKYLSMFRVVFSFFLSSRGGGWLAATCLRTGRTQHTAGRHRWIRYVPVAWDARSVSNDGKLDQSRRPSISNGDGARSRILFDLWLGDNGTAAWERD